MLKSWHCTYRIPLHLYFQVTYDLEVDAYSQHLEQVYRLCDRCKIRVQEELRRQHRDLGLSELVAEHSQSSLGEEEEEEESLWQVGLSCGELFSSADDVSSAELMVLLICPSSVVRRPSVNFCFKSLLLLQFLFDHSEFFTGETSHIVPPYNKAGISNFCLEFQKLQKFQISSKRYSSFSSYSIILKFILEKLGI